jgi:hypothetical protein
MRSDDQGKSSHGHGFMGTESYRLEAIREAKSSCNPEIEEGEEEFKDATSC